MKLARIIVSQKLQSLIITSSLGPVELLLTLIRGDKKMVDHTINCIAIIYVLKVTKTQDL